MIDIIILIGIFCLGGVSGFLIAAILTVGGRSD